MALNLYYLVSTRGAKFEIWIVYLSHYWNLLGSDGQYYMGELHPKIMNIWDQISFSCFLFWSPFNLAFIWEGIHR